MEVRAETERKIRSRRLARCAGCRLSDELCICAMLVPIEVRTRVVLVTHRKETWKTSNTGRLVARALAGAELRIRGDRDPRSGAAVRVLGDASLPDAPEVAPGSPRLVLFPIEGARALDDRDANGPPCVLVVPDGTWTQARKVMRRDPLAQGAEIVTLPSGARSRYRLRRNERDGGLCTIEAVARALAILEGPTEGPTASAHLDAIFDAFVTRLRDIRGLHHP